jgi:polyisoprenoid-binding protein YceI
MQINKWAIDPTHSEVQFKVKHLVITTLTGSFNEFNGEIEADDSFQNLKATFDASVGSIDTNNEGRDGHLKSSDFFDAENFPKITFISTGMVQKSTGNFELNGDITLKGVTKPTTFNVIYEGTATDPYGQIKAGFEVTGKINRHDFGLTWSALTEAGGAVLSDEVKLIGNIQLVKQA